MENKKDVVLYVGVTLIVVGIIELLTALNVFPNFSEWWTPIVLIILGILVTLKAKGTVQILGVITLVYGVILLLMTIGLFYVAFLWQIIDISYILVGLMLLL